MVNKGKSTGCYTCRSRKIKCGQQIFAEYLDDRELTVSADETTPGCQRCQKAGVQCPGYESRFLLVKEASNCDLGPNRSNGSIVKKFVLYTDNLQQRINKGPELPMSLDLNAFSNIIYRSFLVDHLLNHSDYGRVHVYLIDGASSSTLGEISFDAMAMRLFGQCHRQENICQKSAAGYGEALGKLRQTMHQKDAAQSISVILSVMALLQYESIKISSLPNFFTHVNGLAALVESRGPTSYVSELEHYVFEMAREIISAVSISHQQRSFLGEKQWLELPWTSHGRPKSPRAKLCDVILQLAGLWEDIRYLKAAKSARANILALRIQVNTTRTQFRHCHETLCLLSTEWYNGNSESFWAVGVDEYRESDRLLLQYPFDVFEPPIEGIDLEALLAYASYNMNMLELVQMNAELCGLESDLEMEIRNTTAPESRARPLFGDAQDSPSSYAKNVCRAVPAAINSPVHGYTGAVGIRWMLHRILPVFELESKEAAWILKVAEICSANMGLESAHAGLHQHWEHVHENRGIIQLTYH